MVAQSLNLTQIQAAKKPSTHAHIQLCQWSANQLHNILIFWNLYFWGQHSLNNVYNFWTNNVWFRRFPVIQFGWNFEWMHRFWFCKIYIPASRLYDLIKNPRSLEAACGQTEPRYFRPPYMVLNRLSLKKTFCPRISPEVPIGSLITKIFYILLYYASGT